MFYFLWSWVLPPFVLNAPGRIRNLLAADLHRSIGLSATPSSSWPGRELRKCHCLEVPGGCLFNFQGPLASGWSSPLGKIPAVIKLYIKAILLGSNQLYPFSSNLGTLSTHFCESAHYNDNLGSSLTGVTICHSLLWLVVTPPKSFVLRPQKCRQTVAASSKLLLSAGIHSPPYWAAFCFILLSDPQCPENL